MRLTILILLIISCPLLSQNIDSLINSLDTARGQPLLSALLDIGTLHIRSNNTLDSYIYLMRTLEESERQENEYYINLSKMMLVSVLTQLGDKERRRSYSKETISYFKSCKDKVHCASNYIVSLINYINSFKDSEKPQFLPELYDLEENYHPSKRFFGALLATISEIEGFNNNPEKAIEYDKKSLDYAAIKANVDINLSYQIYNIISANHPNTDSAYYYAHKTIANRTVRRDYNIISNNYKIIADYHQRYNNADSSKYYRNLQIENLDSLRLYQIDKKVNELNLSHDLKVLEFEEQKKSEILRLWLIGAALVLLPIIVALTFILWLNQKKRKAEKKGEDLMLEIFRYQVLEKIRFADNMEEIRIGFNEVYKGKFKKLLNLGLTNQEVNITVLDHLKITPTRQAQILNLSKDSIYTTRTRAKRNIKEKSLYDDVQEILHDKNM